MNFEKLLKFLHGLVLFLGIATLAGSIYFTVKTWPDKPSIDPKVIWIGINIALAVTFLFVLNKTRTYRPHLKIKHLGKRILSLEEKAIIEHWRTIRAKAFSRDPDQMKLAIIEADKVAEQALASVGFTGETTGDKINQILVDELGWIRRAAMSAHKYRNKIIDMPAEEIDADDVKKSIHNYEILLKELDIIDPAEL